MFYSLDGDHEIVIITVHFKPPLPIEFVKIPLPNRISSIFYI